MKLSIVFSSAIFSAGVLAAPRRSGLDEHGNRKPANRHMSTPAKILHEADDINGSDVTHVQYSSNWAGAVLTAPPPGTTFNAVSGQFTAPSASSMNGQAASASIWVGIDGDTYGSAILQAGIDVSFNADGTQSYDAWYEWFPNAAVFFPGDEFPITAGNVITISIASSDASTGAVVLVNESTGQLVTQHVSAPNPSSILAGQNAEWIVEDYESGGSLVSFANLGAVLFSNCIAGDSNGDSLGTDGATIVEIVDRSGNVLTDVSIPSASQILLEI